MKLKKIILCFVLILVVTNIFSDPVKLYEAGKRNQNRGDWYGAIENYQAALLENPTYNLVFYGLAECFYALSEYDQALDYVKKALVYKRDSSELQNLHGFILIGLGDLDSAKKIFKNVLNIYPNNLSARFGLAEIEVSYGKLISATALYKAALERQTDNRKALLSLALISYESGKINFAKDYINRALKYHGDSHQVHYFAAYISAMEGDNLTAEGRLRVALKLKPDYDEAMALLASVLYAQGRYSNSIDICDQRIVNDRNAADAWYLKTLNLLKQNRSNDAMKSARIGLSIQPENEIMRAVLEDIAITYLDFENPARKNLAEFHIKKADGLARKNIINFALYEYRRALKVYPYDVDSRYQYAKILLRLGYTQRYLEQMEFIQSITKSNTKVNDAVESYRKLLLTSIQNKWNINPLYLDKGHIGISLFYELNSSNVLHPEAEKVATKMIADIFSYNRRFEIKQVIDKPYSYKDAFRIARTSGSDYFGIINLHETDRDIKVSIDLYVARTGSPAKTFSVFRSANDRYSNALLRLSQMLSNSMPHIGVIVNRHQNEAIVDLGRNDGDYKNAEFKIVEKGKIAFNREGIGVTFADDSILGLFDPKKLEEDLTEGQIRRKGYYDRVNKGDYIISLVKEQEITNSEIKSNKGGKLINTEVDFLNTNRNDPILLKLLKTIRQFDK